MRPILGFVLGFGFSISANAAIAPDSLAGKAYHEVFGRGIISSVGEAVVLLGSDGKYSFLKSAIGQATQSPPISMLALPRDGTYTYLRTGETTGTLTLLEPGGTLDARTTSGTTSSTVIALTFTDSASGQTTFGVPAALGQFYLTDLSPVGRASPVANVSMRGTVSPGRPLITGFVVPGTSSSVTKSVDVYVRVVGPGLSQFGVSGVWADPNFVVQGPGGPPTTVWTDAHAADWSATTDAATAFEKISAYVGAFPLTRGSKDAAGVLRVVPGSYTVVAAASAGDPGGEALIEVYVLP